MLTGRSRLLTSAPTFSVASTSTDNSVTFTTNAPTVVINQAGVQTVNGSFELGNVGFSSGYTFSPGNLVSAVV